MVIKGCKSIAEYAMRRWMSENGFSDEHFVLSVDGKEGIIRDGSGDTIVLVYDNTEKCVYEKDLMAVHEL